MGSTAEIEAKDVDGEITLKFDVPAGLKAEADPVKGDAKEVKIKISADACEVQ